MTPPLPIPAPTREDRRGHEPSAYAPDPAHVAAVDWTPRCVLVDRVPRAVIAAEFHYFRVPDRARWRPLLAAIRGAGFNAVRLYFHWGYHSPAEGFLLFDGNRDVHYLLALCEELHLFVIAAPGPYICAEVQAGGYPLWLVAKRNVRVRHLVNPPIGLIKRWDDVFHGYCASYFRAILPILVPHERTNNPRGCIIALQIENELREQTAGIIGGLDDEVRLLAEVAREAGSTVPHYHNDDNPVGSWASSEPHRDPKHLFRKHGPPAYRADLYGFDLYFTFPPGDMSGDMSSCQLGMVEGGGISAALNMCGIGGPGVGGSDTPGLRCLFKEGLKHAPPPALGWAATSQLPKAVDTLEVKMQRIGGSATSAPPFVAETQVGWINQWGRLRNYDDIYTFFGDQFSSTLQLSLMAQGIVTSNHYMGYGGTNHGALGDSEVYTSYDYSAFIREFGMLSMRGRRMRLAALFARTFATRGLAYTDLLGGGKRASDADRAGHRRSINAITHRVKTTVASALVSVRQTVLPDGEGAIGISAAVQHQPPMFAFLRNLFSSNAVGRFNIIVDSVVIPCCLDPCEAQIVPLYYPLAPFAPSTASPGTRVAPFSVFACTIPIIARTIYAGGELWVLRVRKAEKGRLILTVPEDERASTSSSQARGIRLNWATLQTAGPSRTDRNEITGSLIATDKDVGAATSILRAPLDELPLSDWDTFVPTSPPVAVRASTEAVGLAFSLSLAGESDACVVSIHDLRHELNGDENSQSNSKTVPLLRLVCLPEDDALTFTADCRVDDPFIAPAFASLGARAELPLPMFSAAWGADELILTPDEAITISYASSTRRPVFLMRYGTDTPHSASLAMRGTSGADGVPQEFSAESFAVTNIVPGLFRYSPPCDSILTALTSSADHLSGADPLSRSYQIPMDGWYRRCLDWNSDVSWSPILYRERDPLDHLMTSGHVAYRLRFRAAARVGSIVINVRHLAFIFCNGVMIGNQICYSHNLASAGAMHGADLAQAGKQRHKLDLGLQAISPSAEGVHEIIILVLSLGQSRSPFLLNDVRNRRGLLSARLSRRMNAIEMQWAISGVDVRNLSNAFSTSGLQMESVANDRACVTGFVPVPENMTRVVPNDGVAFFRSTFKVPSCIVSGGDIRYPLRIRIETGPRAVVMLWVNGLHVGRFLEALGPQKDFYVPEGIILDCKDNLIVAAVYGPAEDAFSIRLLPWVVDHRTGNLDEEGGSVFALGTVRLKLAGNK